uniref:Uncharacterized protein n=1 Tax=Leersia perrieri TaxID=77586 RepID=A0A0D9XI50_9ORYZ
MDRAIVVLICPYPATDIAHALGLPKKKLWPLVDPKHVLSGNFAPVVEQPPTHCPVINGTIPSCLAGGAYIRNGPNPQHRLPKRTHHLFDGDGMLHSLLSLCPQQHRRQSPCSAHARYVQTYKYHLEHEAGAPIFPNFFSGFKGLAGLARLAVMSARIAFMHFASLTSPIPYTSTATGEVTTLGRCDFDDHRTIGMTAHPKMDPVNGELFSFRYSMLQPFLTYIWFDRAGNKVANVPIFSLQKPSMLHDFAITERYAIFPESQLVMSPLDMAVHGGSLVRLDREMVPRIGVLPRYARDESEMRWFEVPGFNMLHATNAWEEADGEELMLVASGNQQLVNQTHAS